MLLGHGFDNLRDFDSSHLKDFARCDKVRLVVVLVGHVDDLPDPGLDDQLGAFIAREEGHVDTASFYISSVLV